MFLEGSGGGLLESTISSGRRLNFSSGPIMGVGSAVVFMGVDGAGSKGVLVGGEGEGEGEGGGGEGGICSVSGGGK